jgi:sugar/nucleoside kinase (ribokinase family)
MFDLITVGNISVDLFYKGESITYKNNRFQLAIGGKYFADSVIEAIGGGGANVAIGGAKLGLKTAVMGKIGNNPFKSLILDKLKQTGVSTKLCQFKDKYFNISTIIYNDNAEHTVVCYRDNQPTIIQSREDYYKICQTNIVYLANLPNVSYTNKLNFLKYLHENSIKVIANFGVTDCRRKKDQLKNFLNFIDILLINEYEFADLVKAPHKDIHFKENIVKWYIPQLTNKILIVTCGKEGSYGYFNNRVCHQPAVKVEKIVNTVGAGDGYSAGFISQYIKSNDIYLSMKSGAEYAKKILSKIEAN